MTVFAWIVPIILQMGTQAPVQMTIKTFSVSQIKKFATISTSLIRTPSSPSRRNSPEKGVTCSLYFGVNRKVSSGTFRFWRSAPIDKRSKVEYLAKRRLQGCVIPRHGSLVVGDEFTQSSLHLFAEYCIMEQSRAGRAADFAPFLPAATFKVKKNRPKIRTFCISI